MIACFDVHYSPFAARAAAIVFERWTSETPIAAYSIALRQCDDYAPGYFYRRELQPLLAVISQIREDISCYVIDGYCYLSDDKQPGLGVRLAQQLPPGKTVIGVAKSRFQDSKHAAEVLRGSSLRPLFVTAVGVNYQEAASFIRSMKGDHRIPTLLKYVDRLSRQMNDEEACGEQWSPRTGSK